MAVLAAPRSSLSQLRDVLATVFGNPALRRVQLAFAGFNAAEWGVWIAMVVYAYDQGGTTTAGLVALAQLTPAALFAPLAAVLGDRHRPGRVLVLGYVAQTAGMGLTAAALLAGGPPLLAYGLSAIAATAVTITRPSQGALVPTLARRPEELTAANVVSGWIESLAVLAAPALTGALLLVGSPGLVYAVMAGLTLVGAVLVLPVPGPPPAGRAPGGDVEVAHAGMLGAFALLRRERAARLLVALLGTEYVAIGALDVLYPEVASAVLGREPGFAGFLNAAFGLGGVLGIAATVGLVGRRRLMPSLLAGLGVWVASFFVLSAGPGVAGALLLLALGGVGHVVVDVSGRTLLQRIAPPDMQARIFGLLEGLAMAALALGSVLVPVLVALGGARAAFVGVGLLLPVAVLAGGRGLLDIDRRADVPVVEIGLLRSLPLFAPLDPVTLEHVARCLTPVAVERGAAVITQGEPGDRFYLIASGSVTVVRDGVAVATLGRGDGFGEIALLREVPRTATCLAETDGLLYALGKPDFLAAVTGHPAAAAAAHRLAAARGAPEPSEQVA
jgi:MFS family permease